MRKVSFSPTEHLLFPAVSRALIVPSFGLRVAGSRRPRSGTRNSQPGTRNSEPRIYGCLLPHWNDGMHYSVRCRFAPFNATMILPMWAFVPR